MELTLLVSPAQILTVTRDPDVRAWDLGADRSRTKTVLAGSPSILIH